jgi:hypothetical protein
MACDWEGSGRDSRPCGKLLRNVRIILRRALRSRSSRQGLDGAIGEVWAAPGGLTQALSQPSPPETACQDSAAPTWRCNPRRLF